MESKNYNEDTTLLIGATELYKILVIQRRQNLLEALEVLIKKTELSVSYGDEIVKARLLTYFLDAGIFLKKVLKNKDNRYNDLFKKILESKSLKDYMTTFQEIDLYLFEYGILSDQIEKRVSLGRKKEPTEVFE